MSRIGIMASVALVAAFAASSAVAQQAQRLSGTIEKVTGNSLLVKAKDGEQTVTLAANDSGQFRCHWVRMKREKSACQWLNDTELQWELPIAHGEGKFMTQDAKTLAALEKNGQVIFRYKGENPNGSMNAIAGICSADGNIVGLMPHPERHVTRLQHPEWTRGAGKKTIPVGLQFFQAAVKN